MQTEIEAKFTDVDPASVRARLQETGATLKQPEILMRCAVFDYPDRWLYASVARCGCEMKGKKITLSYKQLNDRTLYGTQEISVVVDDFEETCHFLLAIGLRSKSHQETRREKWLYGEVEITIDTWPWIPTFMEIEGSSEKVVMQTARDLRFDWSKALYGSVEPVY